MTNVTKLKTKTFPWKLHEMLEKADQEGFNDLVSWLPDGRSFKVYKPAVFVEKIMPKFFRQSKYKSFQRQLNLWRFERLSTGPHKGGYFHPEFFVREKRYEIYNMQRQKLKGSPSPKSKEKQTKSEEKVEIIARIANTQSTTIAKKRRQSSGAVSVISEGSCTDNDCHSSSVTSGSDYEQFPEFPPTFLTTSIPDTYTSSLPCRIEDQDCPQTGDCIDFEGRSYFFIDEEEIRDTTIAECDTMSLRIFPPRPPVATLHVPTLLSHKSLSAANILSEISRRRAVEIFAANRMTAIGC